MPAGQIGQIVVGGGAHFEGYTSGESKPFHDGFIVTGDLGYFDSAGRLFVTGRDDETIESSGENVYPIEVVRVLEDHDAVAEAVVLGVDDAQYGQRLAGFVVLRMGASASEDELKEHVRKQLSGYRSPGLSRFWMSYPGGPLAKSHVAISSL